MSVPVDTFVDARDGQDEWDRPKKTKKDKKSRRKSTKDDYDIADQDKPPDKAKEPYDPIDREVSSVVSDPTRYDDASEGKSNGSRVDADDDMKSVASAPATSADRKKKEERRSGFFGMFGKGTNGATDRGDKESPQNGTDDKKQSFS